MRRSTKLILAAAIIAVVLAVCLGITAARADDGQDNGRVIVVQGQDETDGAVNVGTDDLINLAKQAGDKVHCWINQAEEVSIVTVILIIIVVLFVVKTSVGNFEPRGRNGKRD